jgi:hypothetical protein
VSKIIQALRDAIAPDLATILLMAHVDKSPLAGAIIMSPQTHTASHLRPGAPGSNRITEIQKTQSAVRFLDPELKRPDYVCLMDDILQWQSHPQYKDVDGAGRCSVLLSSPDCGVDSHRFVLIVCQTSNTAWVYTATVAYICTQLTV